MKTANGILIVLATSVVAAGTTFGCVTDDVPIGTDDGATGHQTWEEPVDVLEGYPFCSDNLFSNCPPNGATDGTPDGIVSGDEGDCYCPRPCTTDAHCPTPTTGTSSPVCASVEGLFRMCALPCGNGEECPDGMTCRTSIETNAGAICVWHDDADEMLRLHPDRCGDHSTRQDCEAVLSDYPVEPDVRCAWVKETVVDRDDAACDSPHIVERCIAVQVEEGDPVVCDSGSNCEGSRGALYWHDAGAGDISLIELERCDVRPYDLQSDHQPCDFSGAEPSPSVCDCACQDR